MQVSIRVNEKESNERAITRFNKRVQASRKIVDVRGRRYHKKSPTKRQVRSGAIMREFYRAKRERNRFY